MAARILTWYLDEVTGDGTNQGPAYCMDTGYALPAKVRIHAQRVPKGQDLIIDIKEDGTSIFGTYTSKLDATPVGRVTTDSYRASLVDGSTSEENAENFAPNKTRLQQYSWITLDVIQSGGAKKISVQLELDRDYAEKTPDEEL